jgi:hypothetical protein
MAWLGIAALFKFQMTPPQFFALDAANGAIGHALLGGAIIDHMDRKGAARRREHAKFLDRLASGPKPQLLEAVLRQVCPGDGHGVFQKAQGAVPPAAMIAPALAECPPENSD